MNKSALKTSTLLALLACAPVAMAQAQQKAPEEKAAPSQAPAAPQATDRAPEKAEPKATAPGRAQNAPKDGTAQSEPKEKSTKGTAEKQTEPKEKSTKGTAQRQTEPQEKSTKGTAEKQSEPKNKSSKEAAEKQTEPKAKSSQDTAGKSAEPHDKNAKSNAQNGASKDQNQAAGAQPKDGSGVRVQVSEQQRSSVHQTLLREKNVNRVSKLNISINVGTHVPRSVRLVALPASVIAIVPQYRNYRYFVVDDDICIVEPNSYEIVDVIRISGSTTAQHDSGNTTRLVLTDEERAIILREIDIRRDSTLGLGALTEGADVPRSVEVRVFPDTIVQRVPKLKGYEFFTAENRIAIVDPQSTKIRLVIEAHR